ncbi:hypothetical protein [Candidatus Chlorohelix sp.]|uniref:hypothetical protein n=1 Tax=Candidatus Chlorohelix sp. TaxID=3139201 RepID=UPI00303DAAE0
MLHPVWFIVPSFMISSLLLLVWSVSLLRQKYSIGLVFITAVVLAETFENIAFGIGLFNDPGALLEILHRIRYLMHSLLLPTFVIVAFELAYRNGAKLKKLTPYVYRSTLLISLVWSAIDLFVPIEPTIVGQLVRYTASDNAPIWMVATGPVVLAFIVLSLIASGAYLWRRQNPPWLFLSATVMFVVSAATAKNEYFWAYGNVVEVLLLASMLEAERKLAHFPVIDRAKARIPSLEQ